MFSAGMREIVKTIFTQLALRKPKWSPFLIVRKIISSLLPSNIPYGQGNLPYCTYQTPHPEGPACLKHPCPRYQRGVFCSRLFEEPLTGGCWLCWVVELCQRYLNLDLLDPPDVASGVCETRLPDQLLTIPAQQ